jgi:hydroxyethylthiazole kinase-like uncharacterized protein yjeF
MSRADAATIAAGTPGAVLMDRAGRAVARAVIRVAGGRYGRRAVVVCGGGNNGGDGFVACRMLRREGMGVRCLLVGERSRVKGDAAHHLDLMERAGLPAEAFDPARLDGADAIVDALFGTGFRGAAEGKAARVIEAMNEHRAPIVAVDIPSGVNGAVGMVEGPAVWAALTVAMAAEKVGTAVTPGALHAGSLEIVDIGIAVGPSGLAMTEADDVRAVLPVRASDSHKRGNGSVALLGGSEGMSGAVVLAAGAAARSGAGYVTAGITAAVDPIVSAALPEVLTRALTTGPVLDTDSLKTFSDVLDRADAVAVGPGLGTGPAQRDLVETILAEVDAPVVVDADGLNVLAGATEVLSARAHATVITPHPGELARLLATTAGTIQADRVAYARRAADDFGCVVVLKGSRSVIARPGGEAMINPTGGPELATAGTGDVLTGLVASLLARGLTDFEAAWAGAFVHGLAGTVAAARLGPTGVLASDVAEALSEAASRARLRSE